MKMCRKVLKTHTHTHTHTSTHRHQQPTNQPKKQRETRIGKQANKQTNTPKTIYTNKYRNNKTTRLLESSFELQTQTQTPAAGCSPKAT